MLLLVTAKLCDFVLFVYLTVVNFGRQPNFNQMKGNSSGTRAQHEKKSHACTHRRRRRRRRLCRRLRRRLRRRRVDDVVVVVVVVVG